MKASEAAMRDAVHFHSQVATHWESNYKSEVFSIRKQVLRELLAGINLTGQKWLDAGCGTGTLARFLAEHKGCKVTGVDASDAMVSRCVCVPNTEFSQVDDICETGFGSEAFDGVLCSSVLEYVPEPGAALRELHRVLKHKGLLLISVPNAHPLARWPVVCMHWLTKPLGRRRWFAFLDHSKHSFSEKAFRRLLHSYGFRVQVVREFGGLRGPGPILGHGLRLMFRAAKRVKN